ncbi:MAG: serine hydrolase domain-containing protein [Chitinophagaceae bacterium]
MSAKFFLIIAIILISIVSSCQQTQSKKDPLVKSFTSSSLHHSDYNFPPLSPEEKHMFAEEAKDFYEKHLKNTGFNGSILVAKNGQVLFEDYHGYANFKTKEPITFSTPFHLASISKTFTGMTVLRFWEEGRISLDDDMQKFFPQFPYYGITVRMLLDHRSGLPNYLNFMDSFWNKKQKATNEDVLNFMVVHKPKITNAPNKAFNYCNTNFVMLALILEKITHIPFPKYMQDSVFKPLGLQNTFVFSIKDTASYVPTYIGNRPYPMDHLDCTYGDKNIYSTVRDLFLWDKALYQHTFVSKGTLDAAFTPYSNERHSMHNYGYAWHLYFNKGDTIVYHNGKWHGENNSFTRLIQHDATIIVLGNKANGNIFRMKDMSVIFTGKVDTTKLKE